MHVIVTGGSSGIGFALAKLAVMDGHSVSIIARDRARLHAALQVLQSTSGVAARLACADVSDAAQIESAIRECEAQFGPCDLLVAGAGVVEPGFFADTSPSTFRLQLETNFFGVVNSARAVLPAMNDRGRGSIMIVSSGTALIGLPGYSAYCASKAALASFAESLRCETKPGVFIGVCFPPDTQTPQLQAELPKRPAEAKAIMGKSPVWPVETVAKEIYRATKTGRKTVYFGWQLKMLSLCGPLIKPLVYKLFSKRP